MRPDGKETAAHFDRKRRRAMVRMAQASGADLEYWAKQVDVDLKFYDLDVPARRADAWSEVGLKLSSADLLRLWNEVGDIMAGGVGNTSDPILGDPFAVFVTGICTNRAGHPQDADYKQTAVIKTGAPVDQAEGTKRIEFLKAQDNVKNCEICGEPIERWETDMTRVSTFRAKEAQGLPMASSIIRGSDL